MRGVLSRVWRRLRSPGLRGRTALAMMAAVVAACAALTITTTAWAADQHRKSQEREVFDAVRRDLDDLLAVLEREPDARTGTEILESGWPDTAHAALEATLIPLDNYADEIPVDRATQWSFVNFTDSVHDRHPDCIRPQAWPVGESMAGAQTWWAEECGPYLVGYGITRPGTETEPGKPWLVIRAMYLPHQDDPVAGLRTALVLWSAGIITVAGLLSLLVASSVIRPVTDAGAMAKAVANGDLAVRIPVKGNDDVAAMSAAINTMADRLTGQIADLERANETQRRFVADVAHELRTPTTALLASAEALRDPDTRDEAAALVAPQLGRLASLTEDLLEISRMDAGRADVVTGSIDIVDLIDEVIAGANSLVGYLGPAELRLTTDPVRLQTVIRNLVANAAQHGEPPITVTLARDDAGVMIEVHDRGAGVPGVLRDRVFDRFVRGDEARHGSSSGLGLAIAAENARLLGGQLTLEPDRSTFRLTLPARDEALTGEP